MTKPKLIVDKRQDERFTLALADYFSITPKQLLTGDLLWSCPLGTVGVEDKWFADLTNSRRNGRLDDELRRLVTVYAVPVLFVRGDIDAWNTAHDTWDETSVQNLLFGRQLYGVYTYRIPGGVAEFDRAAEAISRLHTYLQQTGPAMQGVRREPLRRYSGPLNEREEIIYNVLGLVTGIRNRRGVAKQIASTTSVREFLNWSVSDFTFAGFSALMGRKLVAMIHKMEAV